MSTQFVSSGVTSSGVVVTSGNILSVLSGGTASTTTITTSNTYQFVSGLAVGTIVSGGVDVVYSGGVDKGAIISTGGTQYLASGGFASGATVLSGGQLRMLSVAKELVAQPSLLLVDEPTAGLAPRPADDVYDLLTRSRDLGITVLLVDQNISRAVAVAESVYLVAMGRVQRQGPGGDFARDLPAIIRETLVGVSHAP